MVEDMLRQYILSKFSRICHVLVETKVIYDVTIRRQLNILNWYGLKACMRRKFVPPLYEKNKKLREEIKELVKKRKQIYSRRTKVYKKKAKV